MLGLSVPAAEAAGTPATMYWGAEINSPGLPPPPTTFVGVNGIEAIAGKGASILTFGDRWQRNGRMLAFPTAGFEAIREHGSYTLYTWQSAGDVSSKFSNAEVLSGRYDDYIHQWAHAAAAWGHPFFLRFDHEGNGSWYTWGEGRNPNGTVPNNNAPGSYAAMWRHVHDIFDAEGASNVTWMWAVNYECSNCPGRYAASLADLYPGNGYVDWTGIDPYNKNHGYWTPFPLLLLGGGRQPLVDTYHKVLAVAPNKPMAIPETGSIEAGGNKPGWISQIYSQANLDMFPAIKAIVYFSEDESDDEIPINSTPASSAAFKAAIGQSMYASNTFANAPAGKILPLAEEVMTLPTVADTYIASDYPTTPRGGVKQLSIISGAQERKAYVRFDLRSLAGKTISEAVLQLTTTSATNAGTTGTVQVRADGNTTWNPTYMTWINNGKPTDIGSILTTFRLPTRSATYSVPLPQVAVQSKEGGLVSFELSTTLADEILIASREASDPSSGPQLILTYR